MIPKNITVEAGQGAASEQLEKVGDAGEPSWLREKKLEAYEKYKKMPMPVFRYGMNILMDYSDLDFEKIKFNAANHSELNDHISANPLEIRDKRIIVCQLRDALKKYPELVEKRLFSSFRATNKLAAMHVALLGDGLFIYIPENTVSEETILLPRTLRQSMIHHILVVAGRNSKASIIEKVNSEEEADVHETVFSSSAVEIFADENSELSWTSIQEYCPNVFSFDYKGSVILRNGSLKWRDYCLGSIFTHSSIESALEGEGSESNIKSLFFGDGTQRFDLGASVIHRASNTKCDISGKGVLNNHAKNVYRGLIKIENSASSSNGYQKEEVLMIGEGAETNSIPQLEIDNDNVKCSHAATTTHLDRQKLFYAMSRGMDEKAATRLFVEGFIEPLIQEIPDEGLREKIRSSIKERVSNG